MLCCHSLYPGVISLYMVSGGAKCPPPFQYSLGHTIPWVIQDSVDSPHQRNRLPDGDCHAELCDVDNRIKQLLPTLPGWKLITFKHCVPRAPTELYARANLEMSERRLKKLVHHPHLTFLRGRKINRCCNGCNIYKGHVYAESKSWATVYEQDIM